MAKWMTGGDKHTGWKDARTGKPLTDREARALVDAKDAEIRRHNAAIRAHEAAKRGKK